MASEASSDTLPDPSMGELESQDLQGQSTNVDIIDDDDNTALNVCIDNVPIPLPLFPQGYLFPQETFTNPPTYSYEEAISGIQRGCDLFWDDVQANRTIQPENPVTEAPPPTNVAPTVQNRQQTKTPTENASVPQSSPAPSAAPNVKPVPQSKTRGVKRGRESEPSPRPTKRPADRNGQPATKKYRRLLPKPTLLGPIQPYSVSPMAPLPHPQQFQANEQFGYSVGNSAWTATMPQPASHGNGTVSPGMQGPYYGSWQTRMVMDPGGVAFSGNASIHRSSYMVPQMQRMTGSVLPTPMSSPSMILNPMPLQQQRMTTSVLPTPMSSPGMILNPMPPQQELANEMTMGSRRPSPVSPPGQIPIAPENLVPHRNLSMLNSGVGGLPAMTAEGTTNPMSWGPQYSHNPFFEDLQSMSQPAMPRMPMEVRPGWTQPVNASQSDLRHNLPGPNPTTR
ncbi:hypothetical protein H9Q72_000463 [Fusarium xylarioides]|uniref:Uncharacterized protein n=1 Tax=Fusarium xylarioides TaxID=221167 RepID=A0A9P7L6R7_9HYPO|nr:hypothetical protein H9Q72_000463 [Fusarium xylarioides]